MCIWLQIFAIFWCPTLMSCPLYGDKDFHCLTSVLFRHLPRLFLAHFYCLQFAYKEHAHIKPFNAHLTISDQIDTLQC